MHLRIYAFGGLLVCGREAYPWRLARACRPVVGYLMTHRKRSVSRDEVAGTLWPEIDTHHARRCLSTALWRLHKSLPDDLPLVSLHDDTLSLNWKSVAWVDAVALERRVEPLIRKKVDALTGSEIARIERGVHIYRGEYLTDIDQEWVLIERQRLRNLFLDGLYSLTLASAARSEWEKAIHYGRRLALEEPLREDLHRLLMRAYAATGNRGKALEQYRICADALARELDIEPMVETQDLFRGISRSVGAQVASHPLRSPNVNPSRRITRVQRMLRLCDKQLQLSLDLLPPSNCTTRRPD